MLARDHREGGAQQLKEECERAGGGVVVWGVWLQLSEKGRGGHASGAQSSVSVRLLPKMHNLNLIVKKCQAN